MKSSVTMSDLILNRYGKIQKSHFKIYSWLVCVTSRFSSQYLADQSTCCLSHLLHSYMLCVDLVMHRSVGCTNVFIYWKTMHRLYDYFLDDGVTAFLNRAIKCELTNNLSTKVMSPCRLPGLIDWIKCLCAIGACPKYWLNEYSLMSHQHAGGCVRSLVMKPCGDL